VVRTLMAGLTAPLLDAALASGEDPEPALIRLLEAAGEAVAAAAAANPEWEGMGSTAVILLYRDGVAHIANVGDSRAYIVRGARAVVVTRDHSAVAQLVEQGHLSEEEARHHPLRNQLTAVLGLEGFFSATYVALRPEPGDRLVLCSDGLWDMLDSTEIGRIVGATDGPATAVQSLVARANEAGGHDNTTVAVVALDP
jgi:PPM family protein phosphatase